MRVWYFQLLRQALLVVAHTKLTCLSYTSNAFAEATLYFHLVSLYLLVLAEGGHVKVVKVLCHIPSSASTRAVLQSCCVPLPFICSSLPFVKPLSGFYFYTGWYSASVRRNSVTQRLSSNLIPTQNPAAQLSALKSRFMNHETLNWAFYLFRWSSFNYRLSPDLSSRSRFLSMA